MDLNSVVIAIGTMSSEDLNTVVEAVRYRRERIARAAKLAFRVGDKVTWSKDGVTYTGTVSSIGPKNVKVLDDPQHGERSLRWTIHPTRLAKI